MIIGWFENSMPNIINTPLAKVKRKTDENIDSLVKEKQIDKGDQLTNKL